MEAMRPWLGDSNPESQAAPGTLDRIPGVSALHGPAFKPILVSGLSVAL